MTSEQIRNKAKKALLDGKYKKALELFLELHQAEPDELRVHVKVAELKEKTGDTAGAVQDYIKIGNAYAEQGFVVQAIAINKIILRLDPSQTQVKERLKELSSERGDDWAITTVTPQDRVQGISISSGDRAKLGFERTPLLSGLSGDELVDFIDSLQLRHIDADDYIYREGEHGKYLYLIGMGTIQLCAKDARGQKRVFSHLSEGDFFGEYSFMCRAEHADEALAETESSVLMIDRTTFDEWVEKYPSIQSTVEDFYRQRVLARLLAITPVFEGVPDGARMALADRFHLRTYSDGETIVKEGDKGDTFFLIRSGRVRLYTSGMKDRNEKVSLGELGEGNFFGEVALLTEKPRTATVIAGGNVELMELTKEDFEDISMKYPSVKKIVEAYQKQRVQDTIKILLNRKPG
jgi:CRP-like cAMP-binding protein